MERPEMFEALEGDELIALARRQTREIKAKGRVMTWYSRDDRDELGRMCTRLSEFLAELNLRDERRRAN